MILIFNISSLAQSLQATATATAATTDIDVRPSVSPVSPAGLSAFCLSVDLSALPRANCSTSVAWLACSLPGSWAGLNLIRPIRPASKPYRRRHSKRRRPEAKTPLVMITISCDLSLVGGGRGSPDFSNNNREV